MAFTDIHCHPLKCGPCPLDAGAGKERRAPREEDLQDTRARSRKRMLSWAPDDDALWMDSPYRKGQFRRLSFPKFYQWADK